MERFGDRVRRLRQASVMRQEDLAQASGINLTTVQRIELGQTRPWTRTIKKLATALGVSSAALVRDTDYVAATAPRTAVPAA